MNDHFVVYFNRNFFFFLISIFSNCSSCRFHLAMGDMLFLHAILETQTQIEMNQLIRLRKALPTERIKKQGAQIRESTKLKREG